MDDLKAAYRAEKKHNLITKIREHMLGLYEGRQKSGAVAIAHTVVYRDNTKEYLTRRYIEEIFITSRSDANRWADGDG